MVLSITIQNIDSVVISVISCENVQIRKKTIPMTGANDNFLLFFQSSCGDIYDCQNGGTIAWNPVKPFKCDCPENFEQELCEKMKSKYFVH